jgi:predicted ATP-dependent endonuclease of OLD family
VRLHRLELHNFKGVRDFALVADGKDISIFGANATGKTTLADSFQYILFDKDSSGRKDFEILPLGPDGKRLPSITEASVEVEIEVDD